MDFYDSIFQYDLEVQNKITERLNSFFKSINLLKNESLINQPNNKESKYKNIQYVINEINSSDKFKSKLILNQKKQLLLRMNNKNKSKINSKYYIYAKDMNKDNQKMDIIQIENTLNKKESNSDKFKQELELDDCFNQKKIYYEQKNEKENIIEEKKNISKLESDINKIVCDIIKQNVKNIYNYKLNEICIKNHKFNINKEEQNNENNNDNNTNNNIKHNNYIKIDLPKKDIYFQDIIQGKENKKIHNNHSTEKNTNYIHYFKDNKKKSIKKELRNSVANNNVNHLKIKVYKNDILNFNNLNNNNINNLLINKMKNLKNDNNSNNMNNINIQIKKNSENDNKVKQKESIKEEKEDTMNNSHKNKNKNNSDKNNNNNDNNNISNNIKNNNYIKIDLPKKDTYFQELKQGKESKKLHNNHSTEKNTNYIHYFKDNNKKSIKKELRNSVTNNNINHLKIKVNKNDILNFNNLNNNNINNLLINKIKNLKKDYNNNDKNNIQSKKYLENENVMIEKEQINNENNNEDNNNKNKIKNHNKTNCEKNNNNDNKNGEQNHKKMIIRNIQRIQIKNIKLKNNPTGYNLTNICKKKLEEFENFEKNNLKKNKQKNRQCASPCEVGLSNRKINILKFKLGKNDLTPVRKHTEKSFKKNNDVDNINVNENSIVSIIDDKMKDIYSQGIRFSSVKKKKINDDKSINDLSQISDPKKINNNNFLINNYKTNINRNNNNLNNKNSFTKESENDNDNDNDNYFIINRNNNNIKKSLSKESGSNSYLPWNVDIANAIANKSNNKGIMIESYLNHAKNNIDANLKNIHEHKKRNKKSNNTHYIYNGNILKKKENNNKIKEQKYENDQIKIRNTKDKDKNIYNANNNFKENKNLADAGYNDTINNKDEPISYREGIKIGGKRRILSTRVHIRGVNSSKNFNTILGKNV